MNMLKVTVTQLLPDLTTPGRSFDFTRWPHELPGLIDGVSRGFNMERTQVRLGDNIIAGVGAPEWHACAVCQNEAAGNVDWQPGWICRNCA